MQCAASWKLLPQQRPSCRQEGRQEDGRLGYLHWPPEMLGVGLDGESGSAELCRHDLDSMNAQSQKVPHHPEILFYSDPMHQRIWSPEPI